MGEYSVPNSLRDAAKIYEERNKVYGDNYKHYGAVVQSLFPDGIVLDTDDEHNRFGVLTMMMSKFTRYAQNFKPVHEEGVLQHVGHADSLDDLAVYCMMLKELDAEFNEREASATAALNHSEKPNIAQPQGGRGQI